MIEQSTWRSHSFKEWTNSFVVLGMPHSIGNGEFPQMIYNKYCSCNWGCYKNIRIDTDKSLWIKSFLHIFSIRVHGSFWVWAQPMRNDVTLQRPPWLSEPIPRMIHRVCYRCRKQIVQAAVVQFRVFICFYTACQYMWSYSKLCSA